MTRLRNAGGEHSPAFPSSLDLTIVALGPEHLADAAAMFAASFRQLRAEVPALPERHGEPAETLPQLELLIPRSTPAVAAFRNGRLVGYMAGRSVPRLRGSGTAVHVPEWAHGVAGPDRAETWAAMYSTLAAAWMGRGWRTHCVSILARDNELADELAWLGFGLFVVDAVRAADDTIEPPAATEAGVPPSADLTIERAIAADLDQLAELDAAADRYYGASPTFLYRRPSANLRNELARRLSEPSSSIWVARSRSRIVSSLYLQGPDEGSCRVVFDPATIAICGAFTVPEARGTGVAGRLLRTVMEWARNAGYARVSVDFESANLLARRFWLRDFEPVCLSFERHLDDRLEPVEGSGADPADSGLEHVR